MQPDSTEHSFSVQGSPSSQETDSGPVHKPFPSHWSPEVHGFSSSHNLPVSAYTKLQVPEKESQTASLHASPGGHSSGMHAVTKSPVEASALRVGTSVSEWGAVDSEESAQPLTQRSHANAKQCVHVFVIVSFVFHRIAALKIGVQCRPVRERV